MGHLGPPHSAAVQHQAPPSYHRYVLNVQCSSDWGPLVAVPGLATPPPEGRQKCQYIWSGFRSVDVMAAKLVDAESELASEQQEVQGQPGVLLLLSLYHWFVWPMTSTLSVGSNRNLSHLET